MLIHIHNKQHRKIIESNIILNYHNIKQTKRPVFSNLTLYKVTLVLNSHNITYLN